MPQSYHDPKFYAGQAVFVPVALERERAWLDRCAAELDADHNDIQRTRDAIAEGERMAAADPSQFSLDDPVYGFTWRTLVKSSVYK